MKFALSGGDDALRNIKAVTEAVGDRPLQADALEAVQPVVDSAKDLAPVGEGDLRDSIEPIVFDDGTVGVVIGDWKGHFFELGTVKMRAQPMLIPAVEANGERVLEDFGGRIGVRIAGAPGDR